MEIVLRSMRKTINKSKLIDGGNAEEIYRSMLDGEYAKIMAQRGTSGLATAIEKQLLNNLENNVVKSGFPIKAEGMKAYQK